MRNANEYNAPDALRPRSTAQFGYAPPPVPTPGYYTGAANAGAQSAPKFAASTPYTSVQGTGTGGSGLGAWSVGHSSSQIAQVLNTMGLRGPGADIIARDAWKAGANGSNEDIKAYLATGMNRRDASALDYLNSLRSTSQARDGALYDARLDAYKTGLTERVKLESVPGVAGFDPASYYADKLRRDAASGELANRRAGVGLDADTLDAESKRLALTRERANAAAAAAAAPTLGYMPTGEQLHARSMVDHNATSDARRSGVAPGSRTEGYYAQQATDKAAAEAAKLASERQSLEDKTRAANQQVADRERGAPVVSPDGRFYWNGRNWASVTSDAESLATMAANRAVSGMKGGAPAAPAAGVDAQALAWLKANPNDPRAAAVRAKLGL